MGKWSATLCVGLALLGGLAVLPAAELDELQSRLLRGYELPMRWENVEGGPEWVAGPRPRYRHDVKMHLVGLVPGTTVTFRIPPRAMIRVVSACGPLDPTDLAIGISDGSGLYAYLPPASSADGRSLLVRPESDTSLLVRVTRPRRFLRGIEKAVALFFSRQDPLGEIAPYRCLLQPDGPSTLVQRCDEANGQKFWYVAPGAPRAVTALGPVRLAVETRLHYPTREARVSQAYRVHVREGGVLHQSLEYETHLESRYPVRVDGHPAVVGRLEVAYVEVPAGKRRLSLDATAPVFLRVLAQPQPDYRAPAHNEPRPSGGQLRAEGASAILQLASWDLSAMQALLISNAPAGDVAARERLALRLSRDNGYREGGLVGAMRMREAGLARPDYPRVRAVAEKIRGSHSFYRDLVPRSGPATSAQHFGWFIARRLLDPGEKARPPLVPVQHREDLLDRLPSGLFVTVPGREAALVYPVPQRFGPSQLRIVVDRSSVVGSAVFFIQLGDQPPLRLEALAQPELPAAAFEVSEAEAALAALPEGGPAGLTGPLGGPFSISRSPGPLVPAGIVELPLPADIREVRLWAGEPAAPLRVALHYRAARPYRLSEMEYLEMLRRAGEEANGHAAFLAGMRGLPLAETGDRATVRELVNHWVPLFRLLRQLDNQFRGAVARAAPTPSGPAAEAAATVVRARHLEGQGQWLGALEAWTVAQRGATGAVRRQALLGQVTALEALGESFLADRQLRALFLYDPDALVQAEALARLDRIARDGGDTEVLLAVYAVEALRRPNPDTLYSLVEALLANGEYELALLTGLGIERARRPARALARAAFQVRWWDVFDELLGHLPPAEARLWKARRALAEGNEPLALELAAGAGAPGQALVAHLKQGDRIRALLGSADQAVLDWARWYAEQPGPHTWRELPTTMGYSQGAFSVYSIGRDLYSRFYEASRDRPVKLGLFGPARLKLEVRPLHAKGSTTPQDDWLTIRAPGLLHLVPVTGNIPTDGLALVGEPTRIPGIAVQPEIDIGSGWYEIEVAPEAMPALVRVHAWRPEAPLPTLPPPTRDTVAAALHGAAPPAIAIAGAPPRQSGRSAAPDALRSLTLPARLLAKGDLEAALALPPGEGDEAVSRRMALLVRLAETRPGERRRSQALGEALFQAHPRVRGLSALRQRLLRLSAWAPVTNIQESAGLRRIQVEGWRPEAPALRVRRALLPPMSPAHQAVTGYERLVLSINALRPTTLRLELAVADVPPLPPVPLTAVYQVDDRPEVQVLLTPQAAVQHRTLEVAAGAHSVRVRIAGPVANQNLRVRLEEKGKDLVVPQERTYQIATQDQPVRLALKGPAWLRIDEFREGETRLRYYLVKAGVQEITLRPEAGQRQALFRVFQRVAAPDQPDVLPRYVTVKPTPVPPPLGQLEDGRRQVEPEKPSDSLFLFHDAYRLGGQEDGTQAITTEFRRRRAFDEDEDVTGDVQGRGGQGRPDEFLELRLTDLFYDEWHRKNWQTDVLVRGRESSGPTLGLREHIRYDPDGVPLTLHLEGSVYLQRPGGAIPPQESRLEWSGLLRGRVAQWREITPKLAHEPSASVFGRLLSLDEQRYQSGRVDLDVFTPYKADHLAGWVVGDTLVYTPEQDRQFWGQLGLVSNENLLTPDHFDFRVGGRRFFAGLGVDSMYRFIHFFPDRDRQQAVQRHLLDLELTWDLIGPHGRVELALGGEYELVTKQYGLNLSLTWFFGAKRGYRDIRPDALAFRELRRRLAGQLLKNNHVQPMP